MPRFYFNVRDGESLLDEVGTELTDWQAARFEAMRRASDVLRDDPVRIALGEDWCIEVTDETGLVLFQMTFLVIEAPAVLRGSLPPS